MTDPHALSLFATLYGVLIHTVHIHICMLPTSVCLLALCSCAGMQSPPHLLTVSACAWVSGLCRCKSACQWNEAPPPTLRYSLCLHISLLFLHTSLSIALLPSAYRTAEQTPLSPLSRSKSLPPSDGSP